MRKNIFSIGFFFPVYEKEVAGSKSIYFKQKYLEKLFNRGITK